MLLSEAWGLRLMLQLSHATPYRPRPPQAGHLWVGARSSGEGPPGRAGLTEE